MKRCPRCSQVYADDMSFCLSDGTPLVDLQADPEATVVSPRANETDQPTFVRSHADLETVVRPAPKTAIWPKVLLAGIVLLFGALGVGGIALWLFWPREVVVVVQNNANTPVQTPITASPSPTRTISNNASDPNLKREQDELDRERKRLEDERRRLDEEKRRVDTPPRFNDPGTTRVAFRRGSTGETVSGTVGRQRSFVLRTMAGQYLSASVRSSDGCVTFTDGSSSAGYSTRSADSYLNIRNNCDEPSKFVLSVTVR
jgi:hypothetical protein